MRTQLTSAPDAPAKAQQLPRWGRVLRDQLAAYLFLLPALALFLIFAWYPIASGVIMSLQRVDLLGSREWAGLANYRLILNDPLFLRAWINTLHFTGLALFFGYLLPFIVSLALNEIRHGRHYFRLAFYVPVILPPLVSVLLWKWMYDPGAGLLNGLLGLLGLPPQPWLQSPRTAMVALAIQAAWAGAGSLILIFLAAMQGVSTQLYEAAELDGANLRQRIRHITIPQLRRPILALLLLQAISSMQVFTTPFVMTDGGPVNATLSVVLLLYRYAFRFQNFGAASAIGIIFCIVLVALSLLYLRLVRHYQSD